MAKIPVVERIMKANDDVAAANRQLLDEHGVHAVNIIAGPGAGKTSLILAVSAALAGRCRVGVIEGDLASDVDAQKVRAAGLPVWVGARCCCLCQAVRSACRRFNSARELLTNFTCRRYRANAVRLKPPCSRCRRW